MTKPLELTVYETDEETGLYVDPRGYTYAHEDVEQFGEWKRLTEAELAAEYWRSERDLTIHGYDAMAYFYLTRECATLDRFASSPHYFEEP